MIGIRALFYLLYIVLGAIIVYRMLAMGLRWESMSGVVLGGLLIALGAYRLNLLARVRSLR